jgi:hypothetical protein
MKLFNNLLEIKTAKKDLTTKSVYIWENSMQWRYFIYHYDLLNNTFYFNGLDEQKWKADILDNIAILSTKAFYQEMKLMSCCLARNLIKKKPKVYVIYRQKNWLIAIAKVNLQAIRWVDRNITELIDATFQKENNNVEKILKIKSDLEDFYMNKPIT